MSITTTKWGNSLGIRIPSQVAEQLDIKPGDDLEFCVKDQSFILKKKGKKRPTLNELLAKIPDNWNPHGEIDWGDPQGKELL